MGRERWAWNRKRGIQAWGRSYGGSDFEMGRRFDKGGGGGPRGVLCADLAGLRVEVDEKGP